jgi:uncharacterized membrane protein YfcA
MVFLITSMIFVAVVMQTISGFGFALVIMPLLTMALGYQTAAPLVALVGLTLYVINFIRYRRAVNFGEVFRLGRSFAWGLLRRSVFPLAFGR